MALSEERSLVRPIPYESFIYPIFPFAVSLFVPCVGKIASNPIPTQLRETTVTMASRLYVGNLSYSTTDEGLRTFFASAGDVKSAEVVIERASGRSKGFGFVEMETEEGANNAMSQLNGKMLDQRPIRIDFAKPKEDRPRSFGGGGGGGYGSDRPQRSFGNGGGNFGSGRGGNDRGGRGGGGRGGRDDRRGRDSGNRDDDY
jgi:uncharacterized membrane protein YgcG